MKKLIPVLATFSIVAALSASALAWNVHGVAAPSFTAAWKSARLCCGGLMNNIQVSTSDNTVVASANTYGAYLYKTSGSCEGAATGGWGAGYAAPCWEQLFTATSAPLTLTQVNDLLQGVLEVTTCNNNTNDAYAFFNKALWVTQNVKAAAASRLWTPTTLTTTISGNQGVNAGTGPTLVCDPANPNVVYASTTTGVNVSGNGLSSGSATFALVSGIGTVGAIPDLIAIDPLSATGTCAAISGSPTCSRHYWVFTSGSGVRETYNGGTSFTSTSGGPVTATGSCGQGGFCFSIKADQFGTLWASIGDTKLYKYVPNGSAGGGTWTNSTPLIVNANVVEFAVDPTSGSAGTLRLAAAGADGNISLSTNGGVSWSAATGTMPISSPNPQPGWIANVNQYSGGDTALAIQGLQFDGSGNLWTVTGIGAFEILSANVAVNAAWVSNNVGMEQLVATHVASCLGNAPVVGVWDRGFFTMQSPDVFPTHYWPDFTYNASFGIIQGGWALDCAAATPNFFSGWAAGFNNVPAKSTDGGTTWAGWTNITGATTNIGGAFAASTTTNWVWVPAAAGAGQNQLLFTTNGAATAWTGATISGQTTPYTNGVGHGFPLAADSVTANAFCLIDSSNNIFSSVDSGATFTKVSTAAISGVKYNDALKAVPGQAGVFYYSGGNAGGNTTNLNFYKITKVTNECDTVTLVNANITNVYGFGFGAALPGGNGFPTIYCYCAVSGIQGVYEIDNGGTTATLINAPAAARTWPNNSTDFINDVSGDMNVYGRVYVGFNGSGYAYIDTANACPWVNFSNVTPNVTLNGTVTLSAQHSGLVPVTGVQFSVDGSNIGSVQTGQTTYSVSWNSGGVAPGAHTLKVQATGNGCSTTSNSFSIPVTTS